MHGSPVAWKAVSSAVVCLPTYNELENLERIVPCLAAVQDHRQPGLPGHFQLPAEDALLHLARRMIVVVIEADLAPRDHFRMPCQAGKAREMLFGGLDGFVRMDPDGRPDPVMLLRKRKRRLQLRRPASAADGRNSHHACRARSIEHRLPVVVELGKLQVRV